MRDIISEVCYLRYKEGLEQKKGRPNVNVCVAEENLEDEIYLNQYSIIILNQINTLICFYS